jgi:hypothetical protein
VHMSCPFFKEGYVGICAASESTYIPSIARIETWCFNRDHKSCPNVISYKIRTVRIKDAQALSHKGDDASARQVRQWRKYGEGTL